MGPCQSRSRKMSSLSAMSSQRRLNSLGQQHTTIVDHVFAFGPCKWICALIAAPLVRVKINAQAKTTYAVAEDSSHTAFFIVNYLPLARTNGAALRGRTSLHTASVEQSSKLLLMRKIRVDEQPLHHHQGDDLASDNNEYVYQERSGPWVPGTQWHGSPRNGEGWAGTTSVC